jgi:hypothetical protein
VFLALKMSQDPVDGVLLLDASDDFDRPTAATAIVLMATHERPSYS